MKRVLILLATVLCLGCKGGKDEAVDEAVEDAAEIDADSTQLDDGYTTLELTKTRTGHITVMIDVNGTPCVFLVDTGGGGTLIDKSKKRKFGLEASKTVDYAAGIGSRSSLVKTEATLQIDGQDIKVDDLYLMDISYINSEFKKNRAKQVDGVLGTDFLDKYGAVIDYAQQKLFLAKERLREK